MSIDWTLPLKQADRPDVEGGSHIGPAMILRAMLDDNGEIIPLSSMRVDRDTLRHFKEQAGSGVRFMLTPERVSSKPAYYKADGTPWLDHHPRLVNTKGTPVKLSDRAERAMRDIAAEAEAKERRRAEYRAAMENDRTKAEADRLAAEAAQDAVEANPLWGLF